LLFRVRDEEGNLSDATPAASRSASKTKERTDAAR